MPPALQSLSVIIIGGGICGLATAIFLAQDGHKVTVLERREKSHDDRRTGGVALFNNSISIFRKRGVWDRIAAVADAGKAPIFTKYSDGEIISVQPKAFGYAMIHRADLLRVLCELADEAGVEVLFSRSIVTIHDQVEHPGVKLADGSILEADLLVGADGISSQVRRYLFPDCKPQLSPSAVMLVDIPESAMHQNERTAELWQESPYRLYLAPGRSIVSWSVTKHNPPTYHLQICDHEYYQGTNYFPEPDLPDAPFIVTIDDMSGIRRRWSDFEPGIQHILNSTTSYTKWKIAELPALPKYSSETGKIVLLGDAAHAVQPFAGQGTNVSIEDAECLASLLQCIESKNRIKDAVSVYDSVRVPRIEGLRAIIEVNVKNYSLSDEKAQKARDEELARPGRTKASGGGQGGRKVWKFKDGTGFVWLEEYETDVEAHKAWSQFQSSLKGNMQVFLTDIPG